MLTIKEILTATKGEWAGDNLTCQVKGISINTRSLVPGEVYIAIKGARHDGHAFIKEAVQKGAVLIITSNKKFLLPGVDSILVKDTVKALGSVAAYYRNKFSIPVIGITGSAGKTTTKDLIAAVLSSRYTVLKNEKTENNHIGVPQTLLRLNQTHQMAVIETGTNQKGDIAWLEKICRPTIVVFTNIGDSHLAGLGTKAGVWREKSKLLKRLGKNNLVIFNLDDPYLRKLKSSPRDFAISTFSVNDPSDFQATEVQRSANNALTFRVRGTIYQLRTPAEHNVYNALAAICCGSYFKIDYNDINNQLKSFKFENGRQELIHSGGILILNDTYNANPVSFASAIRSLDQLPCAGKRIVVCADMLELGSMSRRLHEQLGPMIAKTNIGTVITFGKDARYISAQFKKYKKTGVAYHCQSREEVHTRLKELCRKGDAVLVKGSRSMQMELTVEYLKDNFN